MRLPSSFWLVLCVISFGSSVLAWSLEHRGDTRQAFPTADIVTITEPGEAAPRAAPPLVEPPEQGAEPMVPAVEAELPTQAPLTAALRADTGDPADAEKGVKVLRCVVRGRVTYVDAASACADGSAGKVTVVPH
ncbi:MAG: hypothetical protein WA210_03455 [Burkholderiaceae bacterium]